MPGTKVAEKSKKSAEVARTRMLEQMREDAGSGHETMGREDIALPFIKLLQAMSPETNKRDSQYIKGAESGMFYNTVTEELFDGEKGMMIIPCFYDKTFIEWVPRQSGGGFVAEHASREAAIANADPGNDVSDTANHFVMVKTKNDRWQQALFPMTSSKLRASRRLNSLIVMKSVEDAKTKETFNPPSFGYMYRVTSAEMENDQGRFFIPKITDLGAVEDIAVYKDARNFYTLCKEGAVRVDFSRFGDQNEATDADAPAF